ncbi:MAG: S9 family peptidase [Candidatus Aminicenantes bacterium]|nr:S9 family peptidase [Candidatus Aminicenantes bacterium]
MKKFPILLIFLSLLFSLEIQDIGKRYHAGVGSIQWISSKAFVFTKGKKIYRYDIDSSSYVELTDITRSFKEKFKKKLVSGFIPLKSGVELLFPADEGVYIYNLDSGTWEYFKIHGRGIDISPDGKKIGFVEDGKLKILIRKTGEIRNLTPDEGKDVFYGKTDWVYGEELELYKGFWWAPDSRNLLFLKFDERKVRSYPVLDFIPLYGKIYHEKYPKAGETNPSVSLGLVDIFGRIKWLPFRDEYIGRAGWIDSRRIYVITLNRSQDTLKFWIYDIVNGQGRVAFTEHSRTWINLTSNFDFYRDKLIWWSERDGHGHLYLYRLKNLSLKLKKQLTKGSWEVTLLYGTDGKKVYFQGNKSSVVERRIYSVDFRGKVKELTPLKGSNMAMFSPDFRYFIDYHSDFLLPHEVLLFRTGGRYSKIASGKPVNKLGLIEPEIKLLKLNGRFYYTMMIKPPNFDPSKKYPVIIYVYGGPHAQVVQRGWRGSTFLTNEYLAQHGFIIFSLDNRGSFGRGKAWEDWIFKHFGKYELEDQLAGVKYLKTLPYVDGNRIGIWGWSYGGYMTLTAMLKAPEVFKAGFAVAPVTDWKYYDSIYTERYMRTPAENPEGYRDSSPVNFASNLKGKLYIAHGTSDDNVHFQNTVAMVKKLLDAKKSFEVMIYPQQSHGIGAYRLDVFKRLIEFFQKNL